MYIDGSKEIKGAADISGGNLDICRGSRVERDASRVYNTITNSRGYCFCRRGLPTLFVKSYNPDSTAVDVSRRQGRKERIDTPVESVMLIKV